VGRRNAELQLDSADSLKGSLREHPLGVQEITDHPERAEQHRRV
jgi:hypothetical protein